MEEKKITTIEELAEYSFGEVVELPPFGPDRPFVARMRRPSLLALAKTGKIPNTLLNQANKLFFGDKGNSKIEEDALKQTMGVIDILCEASFIEPKYSELRQAGIELTDQQYLFVFNYTQKGINDSSNFRLEQGDSEDNSAV